MAGEDNNKYCVLELPYPLSGISCLEGPVGPLTTVNSVDLFALLNFCDMDQNTRLLRCGFDPSPPPQHLMTPEQSKWHATIRHLVISKPRSFQHRVIGSAFNPKTRREEKCSLDLWIYVFVSQNPGESEIVVRFQPLSELQCRVWDEADNLDKVCQQAAKSFLCDEHQHLHMSMVAIINSFISVPVDYFTKPSEADRMAEIKRVSPKTWSPHQIAHTSGESFGYISSVRPLPEVMALPWAQGTEPILVPSATTGQGSLIMADFQHGQHPRPEQSGNNMTSFPNLMGASMMNPMMSPPQPPLQAGFAAAVQVPLPGFFQNPWHVPTPGPQPAVNNQTGNFNWLGPSTPVPGNQTVPPISIEARQQGQSEKRGKRKDNLPSGNEVYQILRRHQEKINLINKQNDDSTVQCKEQKIVPHKKGQGKKGHNNQ